MSTLQTGFQVVSRTAQHGLVESSESNTAKEKWFYVWCGDIAGELVDTKLWKRYPNGFNARDSVNRAV